jgi:hypothetical protein
VEASVPLVVFTNALRFLRDRTRPFEFKINDGASSVRAKFARVTAELTTNERNQVPAPPAEFVALHERLDALFDRRLRNAIAHSTYRVDLAGTPVDLWDTFGEPPQSCTF